VYFKTYQDQIKDKIVTGKTIAKQLQHFRPGKHNEIEFAGFTDVAGNLHPRPPATDFNYAPEPVYEDRPVHVDYGLEAVEYESSYPEFQERISTTPDSSFRVVREDYSQESSWQEGQERAEILDAIVEAQQEQDFSSDPLSPEQEIELNIHMAQAGYLDSSPNVDQQDQTLEQRVQESFDNQMSPTNPMNPFGFHPDPLAPFNGIDPFSPGNQGNGM
jgi:hypothetical protein